MANLQVNKRILKWRPFWNKVYATLPTLLRSTLPSAAMKPTLFAGATRSQSPQGNSLMSYVSVGIVYGYPSANITLCFFELCQETKIWL